MTGHPGTGNEADLRENRTNPACAGLEVCRSIRCAIDCTPGISCSWARSGFGVSRVGFVAMRAGVFGLEFQRYRLYGVATSLVRYRSGRDMNALVWERVPW